jgi:transposase-like protein
MNETKPTNENPPQKKRSRRTYDAEFKKAAVEHCARHGG